VGEDGEVQGKAKSRKLKPEMETREPNQQAESGFQFKFLLSVICFAPLFEAFPELIHQATVGLIEDKRQSLRPGVKTSDHLGVGAFFVRLQAEPEATAKKPCRRPKSS
jgi:hypothetical protein